MDREEQVREDILRAGKKLAERFFVASNDGNISGRVNDGEILITPTGVNKGDMLPDWIVKVDLEGNVLSGSLEPTSEMKMHLRIFQKRPDIRAIVHAHPPAATGFAACRIRLDQEVVLPEVVFGLGKISLAEYGTPTTEEVPQAVEQEIGDCDALLLANHGALTVGNSIMQAYYRMEVLEMYARVRLVARLLGGPKTLNEREVEDLLRVKAGHGWNGLSEDNREIDQNLVQIITNVVLEVLKSQ